jgi:hypothetical protein
MIVLHLRYLAVLLFAGSLLAQAPAPPDNWAGAGAAYNQAASPQVSGWAAYATLLSAKGPIYSFTEYQIVSVKTKPWTVGTAVTTGVATPLKTGALTKGAWTWTLFGVATGGVSAGGSSASGAFTGGGVGILQLGKTNWDLTFGVQYLASVQTKQSLYLFGFGRTF